MDRACKFEREETKFMANAYIVRSPVCHISHIHISDIRRNNNTTAELMNKAPLSIDHNTNKYLFLGKVPNLHLSCIILSSGNCFLSAGIKIIIPVVIDTSDLF